jgi:indole-3-glycerol phosphate synthase
MHDRLAALLKHKEAEVAALKAELAKEPNGQLAQLFYGKNNALPSRKSFTKALQRANHIKVIAELKRRSPSKGLLKEVSDPTAWVEKYIGGGAAAVSILTDSHGFGGSLVDLQTISNTFSHTSVPFLRKDFLIDPLQIAESILHGADAVLLIVAALDDRLPLMLQTARELHIDALVEVHTPTEAEQAVAAGATIIGVNNRDLRSFDIDTRRAFDILKYLPESAIKIAESGIEDASLAREYHDAGYAAVLVGEALVKSEDPAKWIQDVQ